MLLCIFCNYGRAHSSAGLYTNLVLCVDAKARQNANVSFVEFYLLLIFRHSSVIFVLAVMVVNDGRTVYL